MTLIVWYTTVKGLMLKIVVALTGASGLLFGVRLANILLENKNISFDLIVSDGAYRVALYELSNFGLENYIDELRRREVSVYRENDFNSPLASSSRSPDAMVIIPCSMKTLASIANGFSDNLVSRAALSVLRLRRPLVLVIRETPLGVIELRNMLRVAEAGGIVLPASPGFYHKPKTIDDMINFVVGKVLDVLGLEHNLYKKWMEEVEE